MKRIFSYYDMEATLRFGTKPWPEKPHVYLANMDVSADIHAFTKIYGQLFYGGQDSPDLVREAQDVLRKAWAKDADALRRLAKGQPESPSGREISLPGGPEGFGPIRSVVLFNRERFHLSVTETGLEIEPDDLWSFTQLAFLRDHNLGETQICANPECKRPYFLQGKRGQIYCSHRCAVATNVRRFREMKSNNLRLKKKKGKTKR